MYWKKPLKPYHNLTAQQIYEDIKNKNSTIVSYSTKTINPFERTKEDKTRDFCYLTEDNPTKAFEVLYMFQDDDINSASFWNAFLGQITEIGDIKKSNKYCKDSLKKVENFSDTFIKKCLTSLAKVLDKKGVLIYKEDRGYFKKWWLRLWRLSVQEKHNHTQFYFNDILLKPPGLLSRSIFHILWSYFDKDKFNNKIPKDGKIPKDIEWYFHTLLKKETRLISSALFYFGDYLYTLWVLDRKWILKNIRPLMNYDKNNNKEVYKAIWTGYCGRIIVYPDFLDDFKEELFQFLIKRKMLYTIELGPINDKDDLYQPIADLFFITTGGKWSKNIFTESQNQNQKLKESFDQEDITFLKVLSQKIWQYLRDSEQKSANLWRKTIHSWIKEFWSPQSAMKDPEIARYFSFALLHCREEFPNAIEILKDYIKEVIKKNNDYIIYYIVDPVESEKNGLEHVFNYPKELLQLLCWNLPEQNVADKNSLKKILDAVKKQHINIMNNQYYKQLENKLS